jgi:hypothetical protein
MLARPEDRGMLNDHLLVLRQQIEFFRATLDDIMSYTRGRNKGVALGQVGRSVPKLSLRSGRPPAQWIPQLSINDTGHVSSGTEC